MKKKQGLDISADGSLTLPAEDASTQTVVVYGGKGKGKTNFGTVLAEELYRNRLKFSALDPYGVMWGLRYGQAKTEKGLEILILGGVHGDLPILPTSGAVVADLVSDEAISTVIDISRHATGKMWSKSEKIRFVADYATRLFERQGEHRRPLMQIIDEAGRYCPQNIPHGAADLARCVGAIEELVEVGRNVGIGVTLITQRSARMNKSVSELAEAMVAFCTLGPNSVEAITDWAGEHIERARWKELVGEIRKLPRGTAMVVSPSWLGLEGQIVPIRARRTFDSSATPRAGASKSRRPGAASMPSLDRYKARMVEVEKEASLGNPAELRKRIAGLERELKAALTGVSALSKAAVEKPPKVERVEVPVLSAKDRKLIERVGDLAEASSLKAHELANAVSILKQRVEQLTAREQANVPLRVRMGLPKSTPPPRASVRTSLPTFEEATKMGTPAPEGVTPARQKILNGLAFVEQVLGASNADRDQLAFLADQSARSSTYANSLGMLRSAQLIDYPAKGRVGLTDEGRAIAVAEGVPSTSSELHALVQRKVPPSRWRIIETLIKAYPKDVDRAELAELSNQSATSSTYSNSLGALRTLGLIDYPNRGSVIATPALFLEGR